MNNRALLEIIIDLSQNYLQVQPCLKDMTIQRHDHLERPFIRG